MKKRTRTIVIQDIDAEELYNQLREIIIDVLRKEHPPPSKDMSRLLTLKETAEFFGVSQRTINNWCRYNLLSPVYIGRRVFFEESGIQDLVQKNKIEKKN